MLHNVFYVKIKKVTFETFCVFNQGDAPRQFRALESVCSFCDHDHVFYINANFSPMLVPNMTRLSRTASFSPLMNIPAELQEDCGAVYHPL